MKKLQLGHTLVVHNFQLMRNGNFIRVFFFFSTESIDKKGISLQKANLEDL